jgi:hypothetical protein
MADPIVNGDTPNADETLIVATGTSPEEVQALTEQNRRLFARAKKAEGFTQDASGNWVKAQKHDAPDLTPPSQPPKMDDALWDIADYIREGYSRDDVSFIVANGGRKALEDPNSYVSIAVRQKQEQRRAEFAAGQANDTSGMSEVEKKYTPEQLKAMSASDLAKILPHA